VNGRRVVRLLIVEDDPEMLEILQHGFREEHYEVVCASSAQDALLAAAVETYAVVLLDVMLPGGTDGFEICRQLRERGNHAPILMLTARDAIEDRVHGLEVGADDYLVKPFAFRELLARVRALARRQPDLLPDVHVHADLQVDLRKRAVRRAGNEITLTAKEFELLEFLVRNAGQVQSRAAITAWVWDDNHDPFANALEVLVRRLRAKIDDDFDPPLIHTVRGAGYRLGE
jgi:DNA-binding response OmpR family regulator